MSSRPEMDATVHIAGAGPSGLACAIELASAGRSVVVHERHPAVGARFDGDHQILPGFGGDPQGAEILEVCGIDATDLEWTPLRNARFFEPGGKLHAARSEEPFAFLLRRGPKEGSLDHALARRALSLGVEIRCGETLPAARTHVFATGLRRVDGLAVERMFRTASADRVDVLLDADLAPGGYAYLFVRRGEATLGIAALGAFTDLGDRLEVAHGVFSSAGAFDEVEPRSASHGMNFSWPETALHEGRPRVGEAAGFQDFLFGLGLRMALLSGWLAARSVLEGSDYDRAWQDLLAPRLRTSLVDRWLYEQGWIRRSLMARVEREDLRELLGSLERDHWGKRLLLPWVLRRRLHRSGDGERIPRKKEARG